LPINPPVKPIAGETRRRDPGRQVYEPKWDGFRSIVLRDGDEVEIGSRNEKPMTRYFPEVVEAVLANFPDRAVIDGEVIDRRTPRATRSTSRPCQQRIHPAATGQAARRADAGQLVAFDLLAIGDEDLTELPFAERRARCKRPSRRQTAGVRDAGHRRSGNCPAVGSPIRGRRAGRAESRRGGADYQPDKRVMTKIKHKRTRLRRGRATGAQEARPDRVAAASPLDERGGLARSA